MKSELKSLSLLILIMVLFLIFIDSKITAFRNDINTVVRVQCQSGQSAAILAKYDDLARGLISQQQTAFRLNSAARDVPKAAADAAFAARFKGDLINIQPADCDKPLLP